MASRFDGKRVAVWGAARSGVAAANLLVDLGARVVLSDTRSLDELESGDLPHRLDPRVELRGGGNVVDGAALLVPSPGIPPGAETLRSALAAGTQLISEIELAASVATAPMVAITGTDGKSTTTAMTGAVVEAAGRAVTVAGNIGDPLSAHVRDVGADGVIVAEVSAFQLWSCRLFRPRIAVVTNIASDHADYFNDDTDAYIAAKARVLADQGPGDTAILNAHDPVVRRFPVAQGASRVEFAPKPLSVGWGFDDGWLTHAGKPVMRADDLPVPGLHNVSNALAALATGSALGLPIDAMLDGLRRYRGLPHRLEPVQTLDEVRYFDDSKATNPHAAATGLRALEPPLVVITGGFDKGLDLAPFIEALIGRARHVVLLGATSARTEHAIANRVPTSLAQDMSQAVARAQSLALPGDTVVLSPAASSFDLYRSYHHRGEVFQAAVRALGGASSPC